MNKEEDILIAKLVKKVCWVATVKEDNWTQIKTEEFSRQNGLLFLIERVQTKSQIVLKEY